MDQIKIGKFISELRKEKNMTQKELALKLGITDRAVSKWENGRGMPDVSLLRKISEIFEISVNELLSAQRIKEKDKKKKLEENYYSIVDSKIKLESDITGYIIYKIIGYFLLFVGLGYFGTEGLWINILVITGSIFVLISAYKLVRSYSMFFRIVFLIIIFLILFIVINYFDYLRVSDGDINKPHFYYQKIEKGGCSAYKKLTFSCISFNGKNEKMNDNSCDEFLFGFNNVEDALNSKYCNIDYDPYEDGLYRKLN